MSDLYNKSESEETEGQKRAIAWFLLALLIVGIVGSVLVAAGGGR